MLEDYTHDQVRFIPGRQAWFNILNLMILVHHIITVKEKSHTISYLETESMFDRIPHLSLLKTVRKLGIMQLPQQTKSRKWKSHSEQHSW